MRTLILVVVFLIPGTALRAKPLEVPSSKATEAEVRQPRTITQYTLPPDLYRKAHNRGRINFISKLASVFYGIFIFWLILDRKIAVRFRDWAERVSRHRPVQALIFVPLLALTVGVLQLPFAIFDEWVLKVYRISVQPWMPWFSDWATNQGVVIVSGSILAYILYAAVRKSPRRWWLYAWLVSLPLIFFFVFVSPYVVDPLFNHYEPLSTKAPQLIPGLQQISRRAGKEVAPERMFWMLASDKTIETNASVDGIGSSARIVIWDTSIAQESRDEILAVFGHEMGHYVLRHMWKHLWFLSVLTLVVLYLCYLWIGPVLARCGEVWGIRAVDDWASLPALLLIASVIAVPATAIDNTFIRIQENHADIYGLEVTHGIVPDVGQVLTRDFQTFGETVLMDPDPNPLQVLLFYQHPPVPERIRLFATYNPWLSRTGPRFVR